jgi:hypothetical protein
MQKLWKMATRMLRDWRLLGKEDKWQQLAVCLNGLKRQVMAPPCLTWRSHTPEVVASISDSSALSYICNGFTHSVSVSENLPGSVPGNIVPNTVL